MSAETRITDFQKDIAARLAADAFFVDVPVFTEHRGDIATDVAIALGALSGQGGKAGVCVIVTQCVADVDSNNVEDPSFVIKLTVRVIENVLINTDATAGTGKAALTVATRIMQSLHLYQAPGICQMLTPSTPAIVPAAEEGCIAYDCNFKTHDCAYEPTLKVAMPTITATSDTHPSTVTLATGDAGAAIYYTLDRSHPCAQNAQATIYTVPFVVSSAAWVRAGTFKTGSVGSNINLKEIN